MHSSVWRRRDGMARHLEFTDKDSLKGRQSATFYWTRGALVRWCEESWCQKARYWRVR